MGAPKLLLPWPRTPAASHASGGIPSADTTTILGRVVQMWRDVAAAQIAVVHAAGDTRLLRELDRLQIGCRIPNASPETGMLGSIRCAASWKGWLPSITHFAIALGDQPQLQTETLKVLMGRSQSDPRRIFLPTWNGRRGHPVLLPKRKLALLVARPVETLRDFLQDQSDWVTDCAVNDPGLLLDVDRPEDYDAALRLWRGTAATTRSKASGKSGTVRTRLHRS